MVSQVLAGTHVCYALAVTLPDVVTHLKQIRDDYYLSTISLQ